MKLLKVIGGPTASGKTSLAIDWAITYQTEILSADSRQCYKELHIGVAKPSEEELNRVPHHFINSHSIHQELSVGDYEEFALNCLHDLFQKHDVVICVGGTGLYIKALCEGIDPMPAVSPIQRKEIETTYRQEGINWLKEEIRKKDPQFFLEGEMENPSRMIRALAFIETHGASIQTFKTGTKKERDFRIESYVLQPDRKVLYDRINQRVDRMLQDGLEDEALSLYPLRHLKNLKTVGYQEWFDYFEGKINREQAIENIKKNTRHYAKRQMTWFKHVGNFTQYPQ